MFVKRKCYLCGNSLKWWESTWCDKCVARLYYKTLFPLILGIMLGFIGVYSLIRFFSVRDIRLLFGFVLLTASMIMLFKYFTYSVAHWKEQRIRREQERISVKEAEIVKYKELRKDIEAMPQYQIWKEEVLKKFGRKCIICGAAENIEVHHRYSFYLIIKRHGIINTVQAYECGALWDVNNGALLCRIHHDKTKSSVYYRKNNSL